MSKSYLNKVELKGGEILLFHRPNAKKPIYHMRLHVRGMVDVHGDKLTYIQESTGEQDLQEAQRVALAGEFDRAVLFVMQSKKTNGSRTE